MVAIETAEMLMRCGYDISRENIKNGLAVVKAPGKFEVISLSPTIIADSTHSAVAIGTVCDSLAEFKEMVGTRIRLCLPEGDLVSMFVDSLYERGYSIEKISVLANAERKEGGDIVTGAPTVRHNTAKLVAKDALDRLDSECTLLITGPVNFTRAIRHALLGILGF
jgi:folylpolyglutamate synthase/dihydropteroate synthase